MKPHKHAQLIHFWADGMPIQWRKLGETAWRDCAHDGPLAPAWVLENDYRVKPLTDLPTTEGITDETK